MSERNEERSCPCCGRHCPAEELSCERGRAYFSGEAAEGGERHGDGEPCEGGAFHRNGGPNGEGPFHGHGRPHGEGPFHGHGAPHGDGEPREEGAFHGGPRQQDDSPEGRALGALRGCGHYLHHSAGHGADAKALLSCLTDEEKEQLAALLEKCLSHWNG